MTSRRLYPAQPIVGVLAAVRRGARCLLLRRGRSADDGKWGFPGGALELGETLAQGAERELAEETGVVGTAVGPLTALDFIDHDEAGQVRYHFALICMVLDWREGEGELREPEAHSALGWFTPEEVLEQGLSTSRSAVELMRLALAWPQP